MDAYINENASGPRQYSPEWYAIRDCVGGSEIYDIMHKQSLADCAAFIRRKVGAQSSGGSVAMGWGSVFEEVLCEMIEIYLDVRVVHRSRCFLAGGIRYSPDGFINFDGTDLLLEMKNPFSRIPDGTVDTKYEAQMQCGLKVIPCVDHALYVDGLFRRWNPATETITPLLRQPPPPAGCREPLYAGYLGFYARSAEYEFRALHTPIDFGDKTNDPVLCRILVNVREACATTHSGRDSRPAQSPDDLMPTIRDDDSGRELPLIGYMPWALYDMHMVDVYRNPNFFHPGTFKLIGDITKAIREIASEPNPGQRDALLATLAEKKRVRRALSYSEIESGFI